MVKITAEPFKIYFRTIVFPLASFARSVFTKAMPVGKGCAETSDQVCLSKVKVVMLHESPHKPGIVEYWYESLVELFV